MLKIKDNVDLKELEKFGFFRWFCYESYIDYYAYDSDIQYYPNVTISDEEDYYNPTPREISVMDYNEEVINILYDLIKADLVEKVEEVSNE